MDLRRTLTLASSTLIRSGVDHALIGGFALAVYGINRATADIDFLADGDRRTDISSSLRHVGFDLIHESPEVLQFGGVGTLDVLLANRPLSRKMIRESRDHDRLGVRVLRPEDLIGLKIQAYVNDRSREYQDKADIQALLRASPPLDWARIEEYATLFDELATIEKMRPS